MKRVENSPMTNEIMDLDQLARFLGRDKRELGKLANRGHLPGRKVGGEWRFHATDIHHWVERELPSWSDDDHLGLDPACPTAGYTAVIAEMMPIGCIDLNPSARSKSSVLRHLVALAERTGYLWDPEAIRQAVDAREARTSTAWPGGYATPHPHRRLPGALGESVIAFVRTSSGIPFGAGDGELTDLFFLVCCTEDRLHLQVLSRLARLMAQPAFADNLRLAAAPAAVRDLIESAELELPG